MPITPIGKGRPRVTRNGTFTPTKTRDAEKQIQAQWRSDIGRGYPDAAALQVTVTAVFARPKSVKRKHHIVKPDADNVAKLCLDSLNGLLWKDDSCIADLRCIKRYAVAGEAEHLIIEVWEVE